MNAITNTPGNAEDLQMVLQYPFSVNVSGPAAVVISQDELHSVRLDSISPSDFQRLEVRARQQYVTAVLLGQEDIDEKRATLFFLAAQSVQRNRRHRASEDKSASQGRVSSTRSSRRRDAVAA